MSDVDDLRERLAAFEGRLKQEEAKLQAVQRIAQALSSTLNLNTLLTLLAVWFVVSYGFGILLHNALDKIQIGGFKLGFWFAQQGSIYVFVVLIFVYVGIMNKIDREFDVHED